MAIDIFLARDSRPGLLTSRDMSGRSREDHHSLLRPQNPTSHNPKARAQAHMRVLQLFLQHGLARDLNVSDSFVQGELRLSASLGGRILCRRVVADLANAQTHGWLSVDVWMMPPRWFQNSRSGWQNTQESHESVPQARRLVAFSKCGAPEPLWPSALSSAPFSERRVLNS